MLAALFDPDGALRRWSRRVAYSDTVLSTELGYRLWLWRRQGARRPTARPVAGWRNTVMRSRADWIAATGQARALGLPLHPTREKHWDTLAMVDCILAATPPTARVLDAGGSLFSVVLPWLFLYGYRDLIAVNLSFTSPVRRGPIRYQHGDITRLEFPDGRFDVVVCQSVLEHGVPIETFLREAARVLTPRGLLLISVDYFDRAVDVTRVRAVDPGYFMFGPEEVRALLDAAAAAGLAVTSPVDLECSEAAIEWRRFRVGYTFLMLTLQKGG